MTHHCTSFQSPAKREFDREPVRSALNWRLSLKVMPNWNLQRSVRTQSLGREWGQASPAGWNDSRNPSQLLAAENFPQRTSFPKTL